MKDIKIDGNVMVTNDAFSLVDHEKAIVSLELGCIWSYLKQDERIVGIAFTGTAKFAVDAIIETGDGVVGESKSGSLHGIQLFLGQTDIETKSANITQGTIEEFGYSSVEEYHGAIQKRLDDKFSGTNSSYDGDKESMIFLGLNADEKEIVLVKGNEGLVFTHDEVVSVIGRDRLVSVDRGRIAISGGERKTLIIDEDGIEGLERLSHIGERIGKRMSDTVAQRLHHICIPRVVCPTHYGSTHDNLDDFDFDTYPDLKQYSLHRGR